MIAPMFVICEACGRPINGSSCDPLARVDPAGWLSPRHPASGRCVDCGTPSGGWHHLGCTDEECDHGQAWGCPDCELHIHLPAPLLQ